MLLSDDLFTISTKKQFEKIALKTFRFQYENNIVYKKFCDYLKTEITNVKSLTQIPFLPIQFFKSHQIVSNTNTFQETFTSSGTTGAITSSHFVTDVTLYEQSYRQAFNQFYGDIENFVVLALLPSYLERSGSSLIYMVSDLIKKSRNPESDFYLNNYDELITKLLLLDNRG
ncbi:MAG: acyl transferase, partial [Flavobacterium sp.]|nr:acyl transferase [Flavobacterium sp.]